MDKRLLRGLAVCATLLGGLAVFSTSQAACRDAVVMVHGNAGSPSHFDATYNRLRSQGYAARELERPSWGTSCASCNTHNSTNIAIVRDAINRARSNSCTGKVDVIGHSMGVTLAAKAIVDNGLRPHVQTFLGIAGAMRGLNSCGTYPFNVAVPSCGAEGLSKKSPLIESLKYHRFADRSVSMKSFNDQVVCAGGWAYCYVEGTHTSNIWYQSNTHTMNWLGHMGLVLYTASTQTSAIQ